MYPHHPFAQQEARKACTEQVSKIRHQLYLHGTRLQRDARRLLNNEDVTHDQMFMLIGSIEFYIEMRKSLAPTVGTDQLTHAIRGDLQRLRKRVSPQELPATQE